MRRTSRILVIGEERSRRGELSEALEKEGFSVDAFKCAEKGIRAAGRSRPDRVIITLKTPLSSGMDAHGRLKRANPGLKVILMTKAGSIMTAKRAMMMGADDYITRPLDVEHIKNVVRGRPVLWGKA